MYTDAARALIEALEADGFRWSRDAGLIPFTGQSIVTQPLPAMPEPEVTLTVAQEKSAPAAVKPDEESRAGVETHTLSKGERVLAWIAVLTLVLMVLGVIANWLVVPEVRHRFKLDPPAAQERKQTHTTESPQKQSLTNSRDAKGTAK